jgi:hypothetical protein
MTEVQDDFVNLEINPPQKRGSLLTRMELSNMNSDLPKQREVDIR